jgi:hypothetical protein
MIQNQGSFTIGSSLLERARENDSEAIELMFRQFLPDDEKIHYIQYFGLKGLWGIGTHEFACLTDRRVADITLGLFGQVSYQDGYLECINSTLMHQPSKLGLYLNVGIYSLFSLLSVGFLYGIPLLLLPFAFQAYYSLVKCGIVLMVKEGIPIYLFANRKYLSRANTLCRQLTIVREDRIKFIKKMH